ncbi:hypothetical protein A3840_08415 [Devosia elaeis]|uniref:Uncharacterized protein n=1 Tax=Devosia elaeis TaxID=1770058 RepID=A0A178HYD9_9HYPH|nr:hypothetical protein A3840_08415 [Devosia elaeis]
MQLERAAAGQVWVPSEARDTPVDPYIEEREARNLNANRAPPHSYGNLNFNPDGPLGKREVAVLLALRGKKDALKESDIHGASIATIEKLGLRGYLVKTRHFYKLLLTDAGQEAATRLAWKKQ